MKRRIPSPARSLGAPVTPRRYRTRGSRSVGSPATSDVSARPSSLAKTITEASEESCALTPLTRKSVLTDNTDIEEPQLPGQSWWKKLDDTSLNVAESLHTYNINNANDVIEELINIEVPSLISKNISLDLPDSSGNQSVASIVLPQRKLFTQIDVARKKFDAVVGPRESMAKPPKSITADKIDDLHLKKLAMQGPPQRSRPAFPADLLSTTPDKTVYNNELTMEVAPKKLFGQQKVENKKLFRKTQLDTSPPKSDKEPAIAGPKMLFNKEQQPYVKPKFLAELLNISGDQTAPNTTKLANEVQRPAHNLFGKHAGVKRKKMFANFIVSESEDEIQDIQPKIFGFPKRAGSKEPLSGRGSSVSRGGHDSPMSTTTDIELEDWKLLPSSTMMVDQLEDMVAGTPAKKTRLSKLSEQKESVGSKASTTVNKTKSNKSITSKNKSVSVQNDSKHKPVSEPDAMVTSQAVQEKENKSNVQHDNENVDMVVENKSKAQDADTNMDDIVQENHATHNVKNKTYSIHKNGSKLSNTNTSVLKEQCNDTGKKVAGENNATYNIKNMTHSIHKNASRFSTTVSKIDNEDPKQLEEPTQAQEKEVKLSEESNNMSKASQYAKLNSKTVHNSDNDDEDIALIYEDDVDQRNVIETNLGLLTIEAQLKVDAAVNESKRISTKAIEESEGNELRKSGLVSLEGEDQGGIEQIHVENERQDEVESEVEQTEEDEQNAVAMSPPKEDEQESIEQIQEDHDEVGTDVEQTEEDEQNAVAMSPPNEDEQESIEQIQEDHDEVETDVEQTEEDEQNAVAMSPPKEDQEESIEQIQEDHDEVETDVEQTEEDEQNAVAMSPPKEDQEESIEQIQEDHDEVETDVEQTEEDEQNAVAMSPRKEEQEESIEQIQEDHDEVETDIEQTEEEIEQDVVEDEIEVEDSEAEQSQAEESNDLTEEPDYDQNESEVEPEEEEEIEQDDEEKENDYEMEQDEETESSNHADMPSEQTPIPDQTHEIQESVNETHDTTGRNRKKTRNDEVLEAMRRGTTSQNTSFKHHGRNTSARKTKSLVRPSVNQPSMVVSGRESIGTNGSNSTDQGSGWDSHRTTRKTLRQTFGKDFTPRKSLRALVMEKSAQTRTLANAELNVTKGPQANSTEINVNEQVSMPSATEDSADDTASDDDVSIRTKQMSLETCLQKLKKDTLERKKRMELAVRESLKAPPRNFIDQFNFKLPAKFASGAHKVSKPPTQPKRAKRSAIQLGALQAEFLEDLKYKPPKRYVPKNASWATLRLYKFLESKLEPKYDYKARVRAEKLVETLYSFGKLIQRAEVAPQGAIDELKVELARLNVVQTHFDFYNFFRNFMPREMMIKVIPDVVNKIPMPKSGLYSDIIRDTNQ